MLMAIRFCWDVFSVIPAFTLLTVLPTHISVYATLDASGNYYCDPDIEFEKKLFEDKIRRVNYFVGSFKNREPPASIAEQNESLLRQGNIHLNLAGKSAECLSNNGINPDSVAIFNSETQKVLMYDYDKLSQTAPELVEYATVPEFPIATIILVASIAGFTAVFRLHRPLHRSPG